VATPQTRLFPLKEQDARYLFFFHNREFYFVGRRDVGCDRMTTPLGTLGLSFVFCLIIAFFFCVDLFIFPAFTALACIFFYVVMHHFGSTHFTN
jgi:hypothetical protein